MVPDGTTSSNGISSSSVMVGGTMSPMSSRAIVPITVITTTIVSRMVTSRRGGRGNVHIQRIVAGSSGAVSSALRNQIGVRELSLVTASGMVTVVVRRSGVSSSRMVRMVDEATSIGIGDRSDRIGGLVHGVDAVLGFRGLRDHLVDLRTVSMVRVSLSGMVAIGGPVRVPPRGTRIDRNHLTRFRFVHNGGTGEGSPARMGTPVVARRGGEAHRMVVSVTVLTLRRGRRGVIGSTRAVRIGIEEVERTSRPISNVSDIIHRSVATPRVIASRVGIITGGTAVRHRYGEIHFSGIPTV